MDKTFLTLGIEHVVIGRVEDDIKPVPAFEGDPVGIANPFLARYLTRADKALVILQAARDPVERLGVVQSDPVIFATGEPIEMFPGFACRVALVNAAIGSEQETLAHRR